MAQAPQDNPDATTRGFTIIEVLIVLAIAGLIMIIVFLAVPVLQRNSRNHSRRKDVSLIYAAIAECITQNAGNRDTCKNVNNLPLDKSKLAIYTGVHYGAGAVDPQIKIPPTWDEPSYQFGVECNAGNTSATPSDVPNRYVVSYLFEGRLNEYGIQGACAES